jgi:hypothetical protein
MNNAAPEAHQNASINHVTAGPNDEILKYCNLLNVADGAAVNTAFSIIY